MCYVCFVTGIDGTGLSLLNPPRPPPTLFTAPRVCAAPAPFTREESSSTSGSDFDSGPPLFGSLPGDHNRQRVASSPPPAALAAQEAPTTTEAGASDSDGSPGTSAGARPLHLPPAAELVVEGGRIGGSGARGLEAILVVRLPPPPATPLSDALATKRLADIDGVGYSAGARGEKEKAADEPSRSRGFSSGGDGGGGGGGMRPRRSSHPPAAQLIDDDDDWVNAIAVAGGGAGGGDMARRRRWLSTAVSRRGDGRFASFNGDESGGGSGGRSVSPSTGGNGPSRAPSLAVEDACSASAAAGVGANGVARGGGAGSNGRMGMSAADQGLGHESDPTAPAPAFSSLVPLLNGGGGERGFSKGDVDEKELAVLSSDEDSAETNGIYEMASDTSTDLNADRRLTGGRTGRHAVDWREPSAHSDGGEDAAEWDGGRSDGDRQLEERRRVAMAVSLFPWRCVACNWPWCRFHSRRPAGHNSSRLRLLSLRLTGVVVLSLMEGLTCLLGFRVVGVNSFQGVAGGACLLLILLAGSRGWRCYLNSCLLCFFCLNRCCSPSSCSLLRFRVTGVFEKRQ